MNISVIGTGYVGLVTGTCLSNVGNKVTCLDIDHNKIDLLKNAKSPIYEPGLSSKIKSGIESKNLQFTSNAKKTIQSTDVIFIAVGTPSLNSGETDLSFVINAANTIAKNLNSNKIVVTKSTVPVGTTHMVKELINNYIKEKELNYIVDFISNPEFLKEGKAIKDFESPDRIILGYETKKALDVMKELYRPFNLHHDKIISMDIKSAELTKYAANAMLATKISFINEIANICEKVGANINHVRSGIGADSRIGFDFIYPGIGFGGSCFPKDLKSIQNFSKEVDYNPKIINAVLDVNQEQRLKFANRIINYLKSNIDDEIIKVSVWGLSFKPETDDIRQAPSLDIIRTLLDAGIHVSAYDPIAIENAKNTFNHQNLSFGENLYDVLESSNALVLCTEWVDFRSPDFDKMKLIMKNNIIFDGKNIYNNRVLSSFGFKHFQIGVRQ
tara:strand:+ start:3036 stop:4364 length:1329 start_codon:yes stop_codon:yes gene_type:complete